MQAVSCDTYCPTRQEKNHERKKTDTQPEENVTVVTLNHDTILFL